MTNNDFRPGDRVSIEATVIGWDDDNTLIQIEVDGLGPPADPDAAVWPDRLTLVERPKRTVTIELDEDQVDYFWNGRLTYAPNAIISKFANAREELNK